MYRWLRVRTSVRVNQIGLILSRSSVTLRGAVRQDVTDTHRVNGWVH